VDGLLDTAIVVDLLRSHEPAGAWLANQSRLGISPVVWLEIIEGAENLRAQARAVALLRRFDRIEVLSGDFDWAIRQALQFRLSHNIGMMDCLIASPAQRLGVPLFTRNLKHFQPMIGALAQKPY
jgi:predicted nucleic acid-binding protein